MDPRYETAKDVRGQIKFLEELDKAEQKRHEELEREMLLRAAKSRSRVEDPEQAKMKARVRVLPRSPRDSFSENVFCGLGQGDAARGDGGTAPKGRQSDGIAGNWTAKKLKLDGDASSAGVVRKDIKKIYIYEEKLTKTNTNDRVPVAGTA